jgi:tetratricopeptide (TPR) repeat protein
MKFKSMLPVAVLTLAIGCQSSGPKEKTNREKVAEQWGHARSMVMYGLAKDQYAAGNFDSARKTVDDALRMDPKNEPLYVMSAKLYIESGQLDQASKDLERARENNTKDAEADYLSGVVAQRWQRNEQARDYYASAFAKAPDETAYLLAESEMLVAMNQQDAALHLLQDKVVFFENSTVIRDAVGQLLIDAHKYKDAADMLRQACILDGTDVTMREHFAMALFLSKQYHEAIENFQTILKDEHHAKRADLWMALAECQTESGQARDARQSLETASQLNPQSPGVWLASARVAMQQKDFSRAETSIKRALSLDPSLSDTRLLLGYLRLQQGKTQEALTNFKRATALNSNDTVSLCMVGYALQKLGRADEALRYYAQALKIKPGDEMAAKMMASLDAKD